MEIIIPLIIAAGIAYIYVSFKKSKKEGVSVQPAAPYKVETPVSTVVETQITDAVTTPATVKLRKPGTPKKATTVKKPVAKAPATKKAPVAKSTTVKKPVAKKPVAKKAPAKKPAPKAS